MANCRPVVPKEETRRRRDRRRRRRKSRGRKGRGRRKRRKWMRLRGEQRKKRRRRGRNRKLNVQSGRIISLVHLTGREFQPSHLLERGSPLCTYPAFQLSPFSVTFSACSVFFIFRYPETLFFLQSHSLLPVSVLFSFTDYELFLTFISVAWWFPDYLSFLFPLYLFFYNISSLFLSFLTPSSYLLDLYSISSSLICSLTF